MPRTHPPSVDLPTLLPDLHPIPQDDGPRPLAQIAYTDTYAEAMSYLRALMAANELSERTLKVTEYIIAINPAHYTCWGFRLRALFQVAKTQPLQAAQADSGEPAVKEELSWLKGEIEYLDKVAVQHEKNYQIWHHRQMVMDRIGELLGERGKEKGNPKVMEVVKCEQVFTGRMFDLDSKNYHVWSYRQWLVRRFNLFQDPAELRYIETLLGRDVRNNSAWNHRFFVVFGSATRPSEDVIKREVDYTQSAIFTAPQNPSPWNYLRGIFAQTGTPLSTLLTFCLEFAPISKPLATAGPGESPTVSDVGEITSSHALDLLAEIYAEKAKLEGRGAAGGEAKEESKLQAVKALELLAERYDPIRANYWDWRKREVLAV